jgi:hypothetical protein
MSLSTVHRLSDDLPKAKLFLELAGDKNTDKHFLLKFYTESAN